VKFVAAAWAPEAEVYGAKKVLISLPVLVIKVDIYLYKQNIY
jgi:hypothetical protein